MTQSSRPASPVPGAAKPASQRQLRVGEEIRHALAWTLERGELREPILAQTPVTITEVRVSPDLKNATAFVTPLGGGDASAVVEALKRASSFLRFELARKINMKFVPRLSFQEDTSFDEFSHIDSLLRRAEVQRDLQRKESRPQADGDDLVPEDAGDWND